MPREAEGIMANPKHTIFVVDDEKIIANPLSNFLRDADFAVETFYDARSALLRASDRLPDILVTDVNMPEMDGITLAKALREQNPNSKVILMTGSPELKTRGRLQADRLDGFALLPKPFSPDQLLRLIITELFNAEFNLGYK
jgi:two-component system chemotaxis response regulator CheY